MHGGEQNVMATPRIWFNLSLILMLILAAPRVFADETVHHDSMLGSGKLLATGGVTQLEGAGGGGLVPWRSSPATARKTRSAPMCITR